MDKSALLEAVLDTLRARHAQKTAAARDAASSATDEESRAEDKYDTRATEASYLARGQAMQVEELATDIAILEALRLPGDSMMTETGAVVEVWLGSESQTFFLLPRAGGLEIEHDGRSITVLNPSSPLGEKLVNRFRRDHFEWREDAAEAEVLKIW